MTAEHDRETRPHGSRGCKVDLQSDDFGDVYVCSCGWRSDGGTRLGKARVKLAEVMAARDEALAKVAEVAIEAPTLAWMQATQPWTAPYSLSFEASKRGCHPRDDQQLTGYRAEPHRSLMHDLMHVTKAVGILSSIAEWADHGSVRTERVDQAEYEGRIADLVMCALHMANNPPEGYERFELQRAVIERVERVNRAEWRPSALAAGSSGVSS